MPKIPVYQQGQTPLATGSLGPRLSFDAMGAPARAMTQLAQQAGDAAFRFGMQEKRNKEERDRAAYNEKYFQLAEDYIRENKDTEATVFKSGFQKFQKQMEDELDNDNSLTPSMRSNIKRFVGNTLMRQNIDGQQKAYNRGLEQTRITRNTTLENIGNQLSALSEADPAYKRLVEQAATIFNDSDQDFIKLGTTRDKYFREVETGRSKVAITAAVDLLDNDALNKEKERLEKRHNEGSISPTDHLALNQALIVADAAIEKKYTDRALEEFSNVLEDPFGATLDLKEITTGLRNNTSFTYVLDGEVKTFDPEPLGIKNAIALANTLESNYGKRYDEFIEGMTTGVTDKIIGKSASEFKSTNGFDDVVGFVEVNVDSLEDDNDKNLAFHSVAVSAADQVMDTVEAKFEQNSISPQELEDTLQNVEFLMTTDRHVYGVSTQRVDDLGESARKQMDRVAKLRDKMAAKTDAVALNFAAVDSFYSGDVVTFDQFTEDQQQAAMGTAALQLLEIDEAGQLLDPKGANKFLNLLNTNNLTNKAIKTEFGQAYSIARAATEFDDRSFETIQNRLLSLRQMKDMGGSIYENHTDKDEREYFNAVFDFMDNIDPDMKSAILQINTIKDNPARLEASKKQLKVAMEDAIYKFENVYFLGFGDKKIVNSSEVRADFQLIAERYVSLTGSTERALELAKEDMSDLYTMSGNTLVRKTKGIQALDEIGGLDAVTQDMASEFLIRNPKFAEDASIEEFSLKQYENGMFMLNHNSLPLFGVSETNTQFTLQELLDFNRIKRLGEAAEGQRTRIQENKDRQTKRNEKAKRKKEAIQTRGYSPDDAALVGLPQSRAVARLKSHHNAMFANIAKIRSGQIDTFMGMSLPQTDPSGLPIISETE
jgi:hypothetical protein